MTLTLAITTTDVITLLYLLAAVLFIYGLKMLSSVKTAVRGNQISALGMLLASVVTLFYLTSGTMVSLAWIAAALIVGAAIGATLATRVQMTGMPQMVALLNGFGGIASLLVAWADYATDPPTGKALTMAIEAGRFTLVDNALAPTWNTLLAIGLAVLIGGVTFTGSLVAFGKLQGLKITPGKPIQFPGQKLLIAVMILVSLGLTGCLIAQHGDAAWTIPVIAVLALALGILLVIGIGGADMPVVISLLNSYSGLAAAMAGFVLHNYCLIITGSLVGASGIILTNIMCKAMNRSLANVLFGGVGFEAASPGATTSDQGTVREMTAEDVAIQLDAAGLVIVVPGYGMAVAQAQHAVAEMANLLAERGVEVKYAIHPVAGRMPGHMNVLLAEANVPYDQLCDLETINPQFEQAGVALVIGANDVTNPAARHDKSSPIYGMPILDVDKARSVVVIKRSLNPGFAGVENELYFLPNCGMLFGDAKSMVNQLVGELKE
jgi:NAD(P) transhydrogenase subunit beta